MQESHIYMNNPLMSYFTLPSFSKIKLEHIVPAIELAVKNCKSITKKFTTQNTAYTWKNFCQPLLEAEDFLKRIFGLVSHLYTTKNSIELRKIYEQSLLIISKYTTWVGKNKKLFEAYINLKNSNDYFMLDTSQKRTIDNIILNFELSGINLEEKKQKEFAKITIKLSELSTMYDNNVMDSTFAWSKLIIQKKELLGFSERALAHAEKKAKNKKKKGWLLTLDMPSYLHTITYCENQALRKEIYLAYNTRASDQKFHDKKWDNSKIISEILFLRNTLSKILGFDSYAHQSLKTKMADNVSTVLTFLKNLIHYVRPRAKEELNNLKMFVQKKYGIKKIYPWDITFYGEKEKQNLYSINEEELRNYFPETKVLYGMFEIIKNIYGITTKKRKDVDVWHEDVKFFDFFDKKNEYIGSIYFDLYSRKNKNNGAWMGDCVSMMRKSNGTLQKPIAYLICNFTPPINQKDSLLTHNEIITLFHEFGHCLHHILTNIEIAAISGVNGICWDAIEFPSQFMENWCWEPEVLNMLSGHYQTGKKIPNIFLKNLIESKNHHIALFILRQLELSVFDFKIHLDFSINKNLSFFLEDISKNISVLPLKKWNKFSHTFSHIFSGGYAAGYYSYLWSKVLALDAYKRFQKEGIFNQNTGKDFLKNVLRPGGSEEPMILFQRFRGNKPNFKSLLKHYNIKC